MAEESKKAEAKATKKTKKQKTVTRGRAYILATFNNTIITLTDSEGNVLASGSPGSIGFKGSKKSTSFAATRAAEDVAAKVQKTGLKEVDVFIKGPGPGRGAAVKGLDSAGITILSLVDVTPLPHNGCRAQKIRRP